MPDQTRSEIIKDNPIGGGLDAFHASFKSVCEGKSLSSAPAVLDQLDRDGNTA
jgi:hypothetical protein